MSSGKLIAGLIIAAVLVAAIGFILTNGETEDVPDGYYNYSVAFSDTFESSAGLEISAADGRSFAIATVIVENDLYEDGIDTSTIIMIWRLTLDRITYDNNVAYSALHPDNWSVNINKGRIWSYVVVFEVPDAAVGKRDLRMDYGYITLEDQPDLRYNPDLKLPDIEVIDE